MSNRKPQWADLQEQDLAPWRALPVTSLLLDRLRREIEDATMMIPHHIENGEYKKADLATAYLRAHERLLNDIEHPRERTEAAPEEPFRDPAALQPKGSYATDSE